MNKRELLMYIEKVDAGLDQPSMLYIYGSAVCILLDQPDRTSLDIDIAAPYSDIDFGALSKAADRAGLPVNPPDITNSNHIEWIQSLRLCLPKPDPDREIILWQGKNLVIKSGSVPDIIASKLIRYDELDQGDIQYLCDQSNIKYSEVRDAAKRLPPPFQADAIVLENLNNFEVDLGMWRREV